MEKPEYISNPDWQYLQTHYASNLEEIVSLLDGGYPIQYLIGNVEFLNTFIKVDKRVLIPRFETETLVDKTIKYAHNIFTKKINIIDLGTGSGCIAIALKKNLDCNVTAIDISKDALTLAKENAILNDVEINFQKRSMIDNLNESYDIIISNPPYIPSNGYVSASVKKYEPSIALYAKDNGLYYYEEILAKHLKHLNKPGFMAFEIGDNEKDLLIEKLAKYNNITYIFENDLQGLPRYLFIFNA